MQVELPNEKIFEVPMQIYNISTGRYETATRYLPEFPKNDLIWKIHVQEAQKSGKWLTTSKEWSAVDRYFAEKEPEQEKRFVYTIAFTGTVLDYRDNTLKEGVVLNPDGTIASAKTVLGEKEGIYLPHKSEYVKNLDGKHMPLISYLYDIKDPKRELPCNAFLEVEASDLRIIVRGGFCGIYGRDAGRTCISANESPTSWGFAAWFVDETMPENTITPEEYERIFAQLNGKTILVEKKP
jgi:hypothetical protein